MAAETDYPPPLSMLDGKYRNGNVDVRRDEKPETFEVVKQPNIGKPPRNLAAIRHSVSSAQLSTEVVNKPIPITPAMCLSFSFSFHYKFIGFDVSFLLFC